MRVYKRNEARGTDNIVHHDLTLSPIPLSKQFTKAHQRWEASTPRHHCYGSPALTGSMSAEPQQNRVIERRNHTLIDMIRSILSYSTLTIGLWMETLKIIIHILNRVPSKSVPKMSSELWTGHKPSLNYLRV
jgi:hypothetical protein